MLSSEGSNKVVNINITINMTNLVYRAEGLASGLGLSQTVAKFGSPEIYHQVLTP